MNVPWVIGASATNPCCCGDECCPYPADNLGVGFFEADLPDDVNVSGVSKARSGSSYGNTTDGVIWESGVWAVYVAGVRTTQNCLISGVVEDQFLDTYTVTLGGPTLTRVSLCVWQTTNWIETTEDCSGLGNSPFSSPTSALQISYTGFGWVMVEYSNEGSAEEPECFVTDFIKDSPQSSPVGLYVGGAYVPGIEVA